MDCWNSNPLYANQQSDEQPQNQLSIASLNQGSGSDIRISLEQQRLQIDQVLQAHNEKIQVALQQQMSLQKKTLSSLAESMARDVLMKKNEEIAHLQMELQNTLQVLQTAMEDRNEWMYLAEGTYEMNKLLISLVPPMQGTNAYALASSSELGSTSSCNQAMNMEEKTIESTHPTPICKHCCVSDACMLILPCLHLCACKSCVANLKMCPICDSAKANVIEARFG